MLHVELLETRAQKNYCRECGKELWYPPEYHILCGECGKWTCGRVCPSIDLAPEVTYWVREKGAKAWCGPYPTLGEALREIFESR